MKTKLFISGFFLILIISNCKKDNVKPMDIDNFSISYKKGSAWVEYSYSAIINQTGLLQITEDNGLTKVNRKSTYHLDDNDMLLIKDKLSSLTEIDINDEYGFHNENAPTDLPVTKLIYNTKDKSDSSFIYYPKENEMPIQFDSFYNTIEQVIMKNDTLIGKTK
jgi:hypothetical protein